MTRRRRLSVRIAVALIALTLTAGALYGLREIRRQMRTPIPVSAASASHPPPASFVVDEPPGLPAVFDLRRHPVAPVEVPPSHVQPVSGWSGSEAWGTWSLGHESTLAVPLDEPRDRILVVNPRRHDDVFEQPQTIEILANGASLGCLTLHHSIPVFTLLWPAEDQHPGRNILAIRVERTMSPQRAGIGRDPRELGIGMRSLAILDADGGFLPAQVRGGAVIRNPPAPNARVANDAPDTVIATAPGSVVWWIGPQALERASVEVSPPDATVTFEGLSTDGSTFPLSDWSTSDDATTVRQRFEPTDGSPRAGAPFLVARIDASDDTPISLRLTSTPPVRTPWSTSPPEAPPDTNVVVVILDAARPDRFGCYGGPRPTSPAIDVLAQESRVYHNIFALAPYTLCSVPTMITGLSFLDHEVIAPEDRLADEAVTLAEILHDAGYTTAAFSSTPNNSRAKGFDQGFDVFFEDWSDGERRLPIDPHRLVDHAVSWLDQTGTDRPYHLLVHIVPPHEPYHPGPEFDRFTDPGYAGPVDGGLEWNVAFNNAATAAGDDDLRHLAALYDGNLLRADDATGRLLERLRSRPDWNRTVVLVTSDHGEALGEHGTIGHNATVYDEMLRVPFILRLPGDGGPGDDHRFGALTDLAPTLLAAAGFETRAGPDSRSLLGPDTDADRALVFRTSHKVPTWGVRTTRHKLVHRGSAASELFDLETDPNESISIIDDDRRLAAALTQYLNSRRDQAPLLEATATSTLAAEDREMLEALGYVD